MTKTETSRRNGDRSTGGATTRQRLLEHLPVRERRLELAGIETAVLEGGEGPPLVLLHGPGEFGAKWLRVLPELVKGHRVVAPDLPGHGASGVGADQLDAERVSVWLDELIERTCTAPATLVGHILGGSIAARYATRHSERLERLVLVDSLGLARFRPSPGFGLSLLHFTMRPNERNHERLWQRCSYDLDGLRDQMGERWEQFEAYNLEGARSPQQKAALRTLMGKVGTPVIEPAELSRITVPTALIWGRHDLANRLKIAEAASARYGWPLQVIEGAADDPIIDQPAAFLRALDAVLDGAPSRETNRSPQSDSTEMEAA